MYYYFLLGALLIAAGIVLGANGSAWSSQIPWDAVTSTAIQRSGTAMPVTSVTGFQVIPNPARTGKTVWFHLKGTLPAGQTAILRIYTLAGGLVKTFRLNAAAPQAAWNTNASPAASGAYVARLKIGRAGFEQKLTIMK